MARKLIDLDELMKYPIRLNHYDKKNGNIHFVYGVESVLEYAEYLPIVDAVEVVHGEWEEDGLYYNCSRCSCSAVFTTYANLVFNYCPYCGATMDGGKKEWI